MVRIVFTTFDPLNIEINILSSILPPNRRNTYYSDSELSDEKKEATDEKTPEEGTHRSAEKEGPRDIPKLVDPDEPINSDRSMGSREQESTRIQENVAFLEPLLGEEVNIDFKDQQAMEVEELVKVDEALGEEETD
ncbi:hypothetical protein V3C99_000491 [Haemonchus contortus]|uniref:Uncharacterized protein n=1 Tax=Haemonchus contortus TaxID=6289 RepID=W6NNI4_HAECO